MPAFLSTFLLIQINSPNAYCSRLTIWDRVIIEAGSLVDLLIEEIDYRLAIEADSLVAREREIDRFTDR